MDTRATPSLNDGLSGRLLIATPSIGDPRFDRSVIVICAHSPEQAMGLVINKPLNDVRLPELLDQLDIEGAETAPDGPVLAGGPMEQDRGFVLHAPDYADGDATLTLPGNLAMTATREILMAMARNDGPSQAALALGYAGWGPGQLDHEIARNAWLVADLDAALVLDPQCDDKWERALALIGVSPDRLSSLAGEA